MYVVVLAHIIFPTQELVLNKFSHIVHIYSNREFLSLDDINAVILNTHCYTFLPLQDKYKEITCSI